MIANGHLFDANAMSPAMLQVRLGTVVMVRLVDDSFRSSKVTVTDRGPYGPERVIDLTSRRLPVSCREPPHRPLQSYRDNTLTQGDARAIEARVMPACLAVLVHRFVATIRRTEHYLRPFLSRTTNHAN